MNIGYEGIYKLISTDDNKALYAYSGEKLNFPVDAKLADLLDGRIEIDLCILKDNEYLDYFSKGQARILKECYYAEKNHLGVDIFAARSVKNIITRYKENNELPHDGHWVV